MFAYGNSFAGSEPDPSVACDLKTCLVQDNFEEYMRLNCGHSFHEDCLQRRSTTHVLCPICHPLLLRKIEQLSTTMNRYKAKGHVVYKRGSAKFQNMSLYCCFLSWSCPFSMFTDRTLFSVQVSCWGRNRQWLRRKRRWRRRRRPKWTRREIQDERRMRRGRVPEKSRKPESNVQRTICLSRQDNRFASLLKREQEAHRRTSNIGKCATQLCMSKLQKNLQIIVWSKGPRKDPPVTSG